MRGDRCCGRPHNYHQTDGWSQEKTCIIHIFVENISILIFIINDQNDATFYDYCFPHCQSSFWQMFCLGTGENWRSLGDNLESLKSHQALKSNCIHGEYQLYFLCSTWHCHDDNRPHLNSQTLNHINSLVCICWALKPSDKTQDKTCSECYIAKAF